MPHHPVVEGQKQHQKNVKAEMGSKRQKNSKENGVNVQGLKAKSQGGDSIRSGVSILHKTKMCTFFQNGKCKRGAKCTYAHSDYQLTEVPDLSHTKLCKAVLDGGVCHDPDCRFAHSASELRGLYGKTGQRPPPPVGPTTPQRFPLDADAQMQDVGQKSFISLQQVVPKSAPTTQASIFADATPHNLRAQALERLPVILSQLLTTNGAASSSPSSTTDQNVVPLSVPFQPVPEAYPQNPPNPVQYRINETVRRLQKISDLMDDLEPSCNRSDVFTWHTMKGTVEGAISKLEASRDQQMNVDGRSLTSSSPRQHSTRQQSMGTNTSDASGVLDAFGRNSFSRQTTAAEFESLSPWQADCSNNAIHKDAAYMGGVRLSDASEINEDAARSSEFQDGRLEEVPAKVDDMQEPDFKDVDTSFMRQESQRSTKSIFEMSNALGLHCHVKNTFLDVDPLETLRKPVRRVRSCTPPPRKQCESPDLDDFDDLDDLGSWHGIPRQTTC